jgi:hypothetical protein
MHRKVPDVDAAKTMPQNQVETSNKGTESTILIDMIYPPVCGPLDGRQTNVCRRGATIGAAPTPAPMIGAPAMNMVVAAMITANRRMTTSRV